MRANRHRTPARLPGACSPLPAPGHANSRGAQSQAQFFKTQRLLVRTETLPIWRRKKGWRRPTRGSLLTSGDPAPVGSAVPGQRPPSTPRAKGRPGNQVPPPGDSEQSLVSQWLQYHLGGLAPEVTAHPPSCPSCGHTADSGDPGQERGLILGNPVVSSDLSPTSALPPASGPK